MPSKVGVLVFLFLLIGNGYAQEIDDHDPLNLVVSSYSEITDIFKLEDHVVRFFVQIEIEDIGKLREEIKDVKRDAKETLDGFQGRLPPGEVKKSFLRLLRNSRNLSEAVQQTIDPSETFDEGLFKDRAENFIREKMYDHCRSIGLKPKTWTGGFIANVKTCTVVKPVEDQFEPYSVECTLDATLYCEGKDKK